MIETGKPVLPSLQKLLQTLVGVKQMKKSGLTEMLYLIQNRGAWLKPFAVEFLLPQWLRSVIWVVACSEEELSSTAETKTQINIAAGAKAPSDFSATDKAAAAL
ncbi:hypothetical protein AVEN_184983-1 [Araneus ventricosus]|uniref:Uncharacterized protein n=1 Tax=Araneus ventricosus TaxID=182803 RepID=A0A4Y2N671_ARAVE|nr:hypothetical protein AVEN_184983-1 [Araneus ventricosus]